MWIAVLPFGCQASDTEAAAVAEGLTEDITTGLSRFSHLSVIARHATHAIDGGSEDKRLLAERIGARYAIEGRVRKASTSLRVNAHLVDVHSGAQLWSDTYAADLTTTDLFSIQDDVTDRIVATVADVHGVLVRAMAQSVRDKPLRDCDDRELALRYWSYHQRYVPEEHARLRDAFEQRVREQPAAADAWAMLAHLYAHEHGFGFNPQPDPLQRAERAARRAVDLQAASQPAWDALATTYFFAHDRDAFFHALERAIALNPRNTDTVAWMGSLLTHMGEYERGCEITRRAISLNPHHPGWYYFAFFHLHYAKGEFTEALAVAKKINMPEHVWAPFALAIAAGQLGHRDEAAAALAAFGALAPDLARDEAALRAASGRWKWTAADVERNLEGFRKARESASADRAVPVAAATDPARSIAVLPFADSSEARDQEWFCDGLAEEILNALTHVDGLKVTARTSAFAFRGKEQDIRQIGKVLDVRTVLEGSVRRSGNRIRVTAQLIDTEHGYQLWSERYDRDLIDVFAVQDEIAQAIVAVLQLKLTSRGAAIAARTASLDAYHEYLKGRQQLYLMAPHNLERARAHFETAVALDPDYAAAYAGLAGCHVGTAMEVREKSAHDLMPLARAAAAKAVALDHTHAEGHAWLARVDAAYDYNWPEALRHYRVAQSCGLAADEVAGCVIFVLTPSRRIDEGVAAATSAVAADPLAASARLALAFSLQAGAAHQRAIAELQRLIELHPNHVIAHLHLGINYLTLNKWPEAIAAAKAAVRMAPWHSGAIDCLAAAFVRSGDRDRLNALLQTAGGQERGFTFYAVTGDFDQAARAHAALIEQRHPSAVLLNTLPIFSRFRHTPDGHALLRQMNLAD
jgi:TolB-like protein/Tfp pilus assembly protein PilF